jgi:t-SNARE complex subunit (syntaxin)
MFKDLSAIVIEQGQLLDRIDYNLEQALHNTEGAVEELGKACGVVAHSHLHLSVSLFASLC